MKYMQIKLVFRREQNLFCVLMEQNKKASDTMLLPISINNRYKEGNHQMKNIRSFGYKKKSSSAEMYEDVPWDQSRDKF